MWEGEPDTVLSSGHSPGLSCSVSGRCGELL